MRSPSAGRIRAAPTRAAARLFPYRLAEFAAGSNDQSEWPPEYAALASFESWALEWVSEWLSLRHGGGIRAAAFSPDGRFAVSASADATARLWDVATGQSLRVFGRTAQTPDWLGAAELAGSAHAGGVLCAAF